MNLQWSTKSTTPTESSGLHSFVALFALRSAGAFSLALARCERRSCSLESLVLARSLHNRSRFSRVRFVCANGLAVSMLFAIFIQSLQLNYTSVESILLMDSSCYKKNVFSFIQRETSARLHAEFLEWEFSSVCYSIATVGQGSHKLTAKKQKK